MKTTISRYRAAAIHLGISATIGTVTLTQQGANVLVQFAANSGYSLKLAGGDLLFNSSATLTAANISNIMIPTA
jgi:hypothetical protein